MTATGAEREQQRRRDPQWWKSAVVYQIYPKSFADSDGDGVGDLGGIIARLDHLVRLGVDAVWLSPVYRSPLVDNGYDISDYQDIEPLFGSLEQMDELIAAAHDRGLAVIMDLVVNHTSDQHAWFEDSRSSRESDLRDFYWWRPPREGFVGGEPGAEPTNWGSFFSGSAWTWDEATGRVLPAHLRPRATRAQLGEPTAARGDLLDDAVVARPWCRRLPDGRHQLHLQAHRPGRARGWPTHPPTVGTVRRPVAAHLQRPADPRVPPGDAPRGLRRPAAPGCSTWGRCPAPPSRRPASTRTRPARSWTWSSSSSTWTSTPVRAASGTSYPCRCRA